LIVFFNLQFFSKVGCPTFLKVKIIKCLLSRVFRKDCIRLAAKEYNQKLIRKLKLKISDYQFFTFKKNKHLYFYSSVYSKKIGMTLTHQPNKDYS